MKTSKQKKSLSNFWKCIDTINSCETKQQLEVARRLCFLYSRQEGNLNLDNHLVIALLMKECILSSK